VTRFTDFPFAESIHQDLAAAGYVTPTPIQAQAIGPILEGRDIIGLAQTGTGKTAAFALPIIHRLRNRMELGALVLAPTRELVAQIVGVFNELGRTSGVRVASVVGGMPMEDDWRALSSWPNVLVATPGRLIDHLEQGTVSFNEIEIFCIDEADRMHDMGFIPQIRRILEHLPAARQTLMLTATMLPDVERLVRRHMKDPVKVLVGPASKPVERAEQHVYRVHEDEKVPLLLELLKHETGRVLIFVKTKRGVDHLARRIGRHHRVARLHGDREQADRDEAMGDFRSGKYRILVATDIAARGIDVDDIEHVINYDFPHAPEDYIHRIGRTARLEAEGKASSFVTPTERRKLVALEKLIGTKLPLETPSGKPVREGEPVDVDLAPPAARHRRHHGRRERGRGEKGDAMPASGAGDAAAGRPGDAGLPSSEPVETTSRDEPAASPAAQSPPPSADQAAPAPGQASSSGQPPADGTKKRRRRRGGRKHRKPGQGEAGRAGQAGPGGQPQAADGAAAAGVIDVAAASAAGAAASAPPAPSAPARTDRQRQPVAAASPAESGEGHAEAPQSPAGEAGEAATGERSGRRRRRRRKSKTGAAESPGQGKADQAASPAAEPPDSGDADLGSDDIPPPDTGRDDDDEFLGRVDGATVIEWD
jgi:ATP-dependent RNA helicase RhlE